MNESRVFMLNGTDMQKIVTRLEGFFRTEKGMEVQSSETTEGYVMYPMLTDGVDAAMPVSFSVKPDSITRIWFGFAQYDSGDIKKPMITPIERKGFTVVEWGGAVLD